MLTQKLLASLEPISSTIPNRKVFPRQTYHLFGVVYRHNMKKSATREPDSSVYVLLDVEGAAPVKVPVVAFAAVTAAVPVCLMRTVLFIALDVVIRVAALVRAVVVMVVRGLVVVVRGFVVVIKITGSVSDLLVDVVTRALMVVVLTFAVVRAV
jgi:hypothetical protein